MKLIILISSLALLILISLFLIPVNTSKSNSVSVSGIVSHLREGGEKDLVINLENSQGILYINRGLENGLNLNELTKKLIGNEVTLHYAKHWSLLNTKMRMKHITQLEFRGDTLYSEF